ncbi:MAG: hypothetical protein U9O78_05085, partial [Patescibacteria group bacterium]|nr:hypothetical protein [Patescibacteria group bacterium]
MKLILQKLKRYFFAPRWHFSRIQFNLVATVLIFAGIVTGSYLTITELILPNVFAANDTTQTWTFNSANSSDYTYDSNLVTVDDNGATVASGVNEFTNPAFTNNNSSWNVSAVAPAGWVAVPGDATYSTNEFLAMKYEAKYDCTDDDDGNTAAECQSAGVCTAGDSNCSASSGLGLDYSAIGSFSTTNVVSTANGGPLVHITQPEAIAACTGDYHLITNAEWMTIARNA